MRCLGRLVNDKRGEWLLQFECTGNYFHLPIRCGNEAAKDNDICADCMAKEALTLKKLQGTNGNSLPGNKPSYLHGRIGGPIPVWSHVYGGDWVNLKLKAGWKISEENMARVKKALEATENETVQPAGPKKRGGRKPKAAAAATLEPKAATLEPTAVAAEPEVKEPAVAEVPTVSAAPAAPAPKRQPKKVGAKATAAAATSAPVQPVVPPPLIMLMPTTEPPSPIEEVIRIKVRRIEVEGRPMYLEPKKQKLYDLKFRYAGRYNTQEQKLVTGFPDSDAEE